MAVHVNYNERMGYWTAMHNGKAIRIWLCKANCLWAEMHFYRKEEDGKRIDMAQLCGFYCDLGHLKRCVSAGCIPDYKGLTFFAEKMTQDTWKAVKALTENGIKVTIK